MADDELMDLANLAVEQELDLIEWRTLDQLEDQAILDSIRRWADRLHSEEMS